MKKIETEITIEADRELVWSTLMNFKAYPDWNPFIKSIRGEAQKGAELEVTIGMKKGKQMDFRPEVLKAENQTEFRWIGKLFIKGLFDGEHYFILEEQANGGTLFKHGENFSGFMVGPLLGMIKEDIQNGFNAMNEALKRQCEKLDRKEYVNVG
ncbi:SRPBCC domain-containing protein [Roseivirga sp. E12]|uniref:SRPBCC domain-containing protein n=1 Tax=Roseivirga sp. E12 TaxID=2819237 RepID=UPI001ABCF8AC|nr:SRPBCC domain-containing protein [Roseivirga sp. E12]MBO3698649.1 SRPBCC domain-containing protein [Roseivirga sp. E12]